MGKIVEVRNLYKDTINDVGKNADTWVSFLKSASWNFKYSFDDQILIYAQRPNATACAEMKEWNEKVKRWVNKNSEVIFVTSKERSNYPFRMVFDVADTHNYKNTPYKLWEIKDEYKSEVIETLESSFGDIDSKDNLSKAINASAYNMVSDNIQDYLRLIQEHKNGTELENMTDEEIQMIFTTTLWASVSYMIMSRAGINADMEINKEEFSYISYFKDPKLITILGSATSDIAELGLREIAKTVINLQRQEKNQNRTFVKNNNLNYDNNRINNKGGENYERDRLQETRRLYDTKYNGRTGENSNREIRKSEIEILERAEKSRVHNIMDGQEISTAFDTNTGTSNRYDKQDSRAISETRGSNRKNEITRPNEMGRTNEQLQNDSGGASDERANLQLELLTEEEQKQNITEAENTSVFSFPQEVIDEILISGSGFENGKFRIFEQFSKGATSKENADFLKNEYGIGGRSYENGIWQDHNSKGITISQSQNDFKLTLNWTKVEKRLRELISLNRYFNSQEQEEYIKWQENNENLENNNIATNESITEEYTYLVGDNVFIGTDEYEIVNITEEKVSVADVKFPLFIQQFDFAEFDKRAKENPYNDHLKKNNRPKTLEDILYNFCNEYDIFDVNEVTKELIQDNLKDTNSQKGLLGYLKSIYEAEDEELREEFETQLLDIITRLEQLIFEEEKEIPKTIDSVEINTEINTTLDIESKENQELKSNVKRKRRNKIEYFDLHPEIATENRNNFKIQDNNLGVGSKKEKYKNNIEAIKILKLCNEENRYATKEEQSILSKYVGWGGIPEAFDSRKDEWHNEYEELKNWLTEKEYNEARESTLTAFYTPPIVIRSIYNALTNMGLEKGNILEPSCRSG